MRVVADTNVVVSGLFWRGPSRFVLDAARTGTIQLFTTAPLLAELEDVLNRPKFLSKITQADATSRSLVLSYAALATIVKPASIDPVILEDPDDDAVLECAISADADAIVSGDSHLRRLEEYSNIRILSARQMMEQLSSIE
jgi:putative PIN family toxin of toxin-antitoxin system